MLPATERTPLKAPLTGGAGPSSGGGTAEAGKVERVHAPVAVVVDRAVHVLQPLAHRAGRGRRGRPVRAADEERVVHVRRRELGAEPVHVQELDAADAVLEDAHVAEAHVDVELA